MSSDQPQFKRVSFARYIHISQVDRLSGEDGDALLKALQLAPEAKDVFNVIKYQDDARQLTLLHYEDFDQSAFPALRQYWTISLEVSSARFRSY